MKRYGLIGFPLRNTFSATYFNEKFKKLHLTDHTYENFPCETIDDVKQILGSYNDLAGFNVTIPHKQNVLTLLHELSEEARLCEAVNCIEIISNNGNMKLIGHNTDVYGFNQSLENWLPHDPNQKALIMGTGGSSKAVAYALKKRNIPYQFVSRTPGLPTSISYRDVDEKVIHDHRLIINCTPIGMFPDTEKKPDLPFHLISPFHYCYDLIYLPEKTRFLELASAQGATIKNGLEMLHLQAEKSWLIWQSAI